VRVSANIATKTLGLLLLLFVLFACNFVFVQSDKDAETPAAKVSHKACKSKPQVTSEYAEKLYLNDKYLKVVKRANDSADSKSVIDRPTKKPLGDVLNALRHINETLDQTSATEFVHHYLFEAGHEIRPSTLQDWKDMPALVHALKSDNLKNFTMEINKIWLDLYRNVDVRAFSRGHATSHVPMKHAFVVPGGRFKEMYYWDTYWTMEGMLVCELHDTVKKMIENFIYLIEQFGLIPNGSRVYYLNRSQPPYFTQMVYSFWNYSVNSAILSKKTRSEYKDFVLDKALLYILREYEFWMCQRSVEIEDSNGTIHKVNLFNVKTDKPRPESFNEDMDTAHGAENKEQVWSDLASAAESGYDFSSRWFEDPMDIKTIRTTNIVPVDLNAIMYKNERIIAEFCRIKGNLACAVKFEKHADDRQNAINALMWSEKNQFWADYNIAKKTINSEVFYVFNLSPLWVDIEAPNGKTKEVIKNSEFNLTKYDGGIPVSFINSSQQWDFPNVWAPNQHSTVMMLLKHDRDLALKVAKNFFQSVYKGWEKHGAFFEKYNAEFPGERGSGGEYEVQSGFGWTNGATLAILDIFKDELLD